MEKNYKISIVEIVSAGAFVSFSSESCGSSDSSTSPDLTPEGYAERINYMPEEDKNKIIANLKEIPIDILSKHISKLSSSDKARLSFTSSKVIDLEAMKDKDSLEKVLEELEISDPNIYDQVDKVLKEISISSFKEEDIMLIKNLDEELLKKIKALLAVGTS